MLPVAVKGFGLDFFRNLIVGGATNGSSHVIFERLVKVDSATKAT
jgi:hypothetical protein